MCRMQTGFRTSAFWHSCLSDTFSFASDPHVRPQISSSNFAVRKIRVALTVAAMALSVSLVVSVTSGYASLEEAAFKFLSQYMGGTDATDSPPERSGWRGSGKILSRNCELIRPCEAPMDALEEDRITISRLGTDATPAQSASAARSASTRPTDRGDRKSSRWSKGAWFDSSDRRCCRCRSICRGTSQEKCRG